jgi:hypothetical protein
MIELILVIDFVEANYICHTRLDLLTWKAGNENLCSIRSFHISSSLERQNAV